MDSVTPSTYDRIADKFAARTAEMGPDLLHAAEAFLGRLRPGGRVLDIGCGPGRDSLCLKSHGAVVIGADLSTAMLQLAQSKGLRDLSQMNMLHLGLRARFFDGVWCNAALLHLPKETAPRALVEFQRVLVPGGIFFVAVQEGTSEGYEPVSYVDEPLQRFFSRYQGEELKAMLRQTGFDVVEHWTHAPLARTWLYFLATARPEP